MLVASALALLIFVVAAIGSLLALDLGRTDHAHWLDALKTWQQLIGSVLGFLGAAGRPEAARAQLQRALELEPDFWIALLIRGGMALDRGDTAAAVADLRRSVETSHGNTQAMAVLAIAYVAAGERGRAEATLQDLERRAATQYVPASSIASVHNALGQEDAALDDLERALLAHDIRMAFLKVDARWNNLRDKPRFQAMASKVGLSGGQAHGRF